MNINFRPHTGEYGRTEGSNGTHVENAGIKENFGNMSQGK